MGRKNPGMRRPPKAGSGGGWRMHIPPSNGNSAPLWKATHLTKLPRDHLSLSKGATRHSKISQAGVVRTCVSVQRAPIVRSSVCLSSAGHRPCLVVLLRTESQREERMARNRMGSEWQGFESFLKLHQKSSALRTAQKQLCLHDATHLGQPAPG